MVMAREASIDFNWQPDVVEADDPLVFTPDYVVTNAAPLSYLVVVRSKFADLPAFGIWADRPQSDDELLEELGSGWRGFATDE